MSLTLFRDVHVLDERAGRWLEDHHVLVENGVVREVADRQGISLKYIERLMPALKAAGFIDSAHGIGGGYRLTREPDQYTLWEILRMAEGSLAPVACLQESTAPCSRAPECRERRQAECAHMPRRR